MARGSGIPRTRDRPRRCRCRWGVSRSRPARRASGMTSGLALRSRPVTARSTVRRETVRAISRPTASDYRMTRMTHLRAVTTISTLAIVGALSTGAAQTQQAPAAARWADWVEADFPFFSSVIDAGRAGSPFPARNLTPRGLVLNLGRGYWVGFDTDLAARRRSLAGQERHTARARPRVVSRTR